MNDELLAAIESARAALLRKGVSIQDAEDFLQFAAMKLSERDTVPENLAGWIYRVAINRRKDAIRAAGRRKVVALFAEPVARPAKCQAEANEEQVRVATCLARLNETDQMLLKLHADGVSNHKIAKILAISVSYARIKVENAKERLRHELVTYSIKA